MDQIDQAIEIYESRVKYTNCFVDFLGFKELVNNSLTFIKEKNLVILKKENSIFKFYYFTNCLECLRVFIDEVNSFKEQISLEYVARDVIDYEAFNNLGFKYYKTFSRYTVFQRERTSALINPKSVVKAKNTDAERIFNIANSVFDPLCDFIPTEEELFNFISNGEVYVIRGDKDLLGFSVCIKTSYGYDFRLNCVNPDFKSGLIGYQFVANLPRDGKRITCWIDDANSSAIRLNESIGFKKDGLKNFIFVKE